MNATANGMLSDMPIVSGLGPRDDPTGIEEMLKVMLPLLSDRIIVAGPFILVCWQESIEFSGVQVYRDIFYSDGCSWQLYLF